MELTIQETAGTSEGQALDTRRGDAVVETENTSDDGRVRLYSRGPDGKRRKVSMGRCSSAELRVLLNNSDARLLERIAEHVDERFSTIIRNLIREKGLELFGPHREGDIEP